MIKQTLLKTLYYEISPEKIPEVTERKNKDRFFHTLVRSYPSAPEITAVTMEERYLPYSVLYYIFQDKDGVRTEGDLKDPALAGCETRPRRGGLRSVRRFAERDGSGRMRAHRPRRSSVFRCKPRMESELAGCRGASRHGAGA